MGVLDQFFAGYNQIKLAATNALLTRRRLLKLGPSLTAEDDPTDGSTILRTSDEVAEVTNESSYILVTSALTTGTASPLSLTDAVMVGQATNGSVDGDGTLGVVSRVFASSGAEVGTGAGQGGLGSTASSTQPYVASSFPGQHGITARLTDASAAPILLYTVAPGCPEGDRDAIVYGYLSYRSDLGANAKWRLWWYYTDVDGIEHPFAPERSISNVRLEIPVVRTYTTQLIKADLGPRQIRQDRPANVELVLFTGLFTTTATGVGPTDNVATVRATNIDRDYPWAFRVTFYANINRADGADTISVAIYNVDTSAVISTGSSDAAGNVEITTNVSSSIIGGGAVNLAVLIYADPGTTTAITYAALQIR